MYWEPLLQDISYLLLYGGVMMLEVVAALYLLLRRGNAFAQEVTSPVRLRRRAAAFLLGDTISHMSWFVGLSHPIAGDPMVSYWVCCVIDVVFLLPTIMGTLLAMLQDRKRPVWPFAAALLPVVAVYVIGILLGNHDFLVPVTVYILLLVALFLVYLVLGVCRYGRWLRDNFADLEHKEIWYSILVLTFFMLFIFLYTFSQSRFTAYLLQVNDLLLTCLLLWRVETLQLLSSGVPQEDEAVLAEPEPVQVATQISLPANIGPLLEKHCEEGGLYLQHDITLEQLARAIGTNRYYLSQYFARQGLTYNAYINGLRIRHFIRLYHEAVASMRSFTAQQLAFESGFHSYSTFRTGCAVQCLESDRRGLRLRCHHRSALWVSASWSGRRQDGKNLLRI